MPVKSQIQMRRDTAANWTSANPTLLSGEWGLETDTKLIKVGNGTSSWNNLDYTLGPVIEEPLSRDPNGAYFTGTSFQQFGIGSNFCSTPDSAALDITGDIDLRVKLSVDGLTNARLIEKTNNANNFSYRFELMGGVSLRFSWSSDGGIGAGLITRNSTANIPSGSTPQWIRVTLDVNNGLSQNVTTFYTSTDGTNWTQLGSASTGTGTTSIFSGTSSLDLGQGVPTLRYYRAQVLNGIDGTVAFDANFESVPAESFAFTESSTNAATVTLTTSRYSFGLPGVALTGTTTLLRTYNTDTYAPFTVTSKPITVRHLAFESIFTPTMTAPVYIAIYRADANLQPTGAPVYASSVIQVPVSGAYRVRVTPFVLNPGVYLVALNHQVSLTFRAWTGGPSFANNTGTNPYVDDLRVVREANSAFGASPLAWNTVTNSAGGFRHSVLLGWT